MEKRKRQMIGLAIGIFLSMLSISVLLNLNIFLPSRNIFIIFTETITVPFITLFIASAIGIQSIMTGFNIEEITITGYSLLYHLPLFAVLSGFIGFQIGTFWKFKKKTTLIILGVISAIILAGTIYNFIQYQGYHAQVLEWTQNITN